MDHTSSIKAQIYRRVITHPYRFNNHSGWVGISHCPVFKNEDEKWFFVSQGRLPQNVGENVYSNAIMMGNIRQMLWTDDGWAVVMPERYAAVPEKKISEKQLIGEWEIILLKYQYAIQQTSQTLQLNADKSVTGTLMGKWNWGADNKILSVGTWNLYVENGLDCESSSRVLTLQFSGINSEGWSVWGKDYKLIP